MAQFFTDFSEYTTGVAPDDWSDRGTATGFTVETTATAGSDSNSTGVVLVVPNSGIVSWDAAGTSSDAEVFALFESSATGTNRNPFAFIRGTSSGSSRIRGGRVYEDSVVVRTVNPGNNVVFGDCTATVQVVTKHYIRYRVNGSDVKIKAWDFGDTEPVGWDIEGTQSLITAAGYVGIERTLSSVYVHEFGVGTGGDSAPTEAVAGGTTGDIIQSIAGYGGIAGPGGIAGRSGGIAG